MIIANFITRRPTMGETRTYEDFYKFLGMKPHRLGIVSRLYPQLTASYLTEALKNIFYVGNEKGSKYRSIDTMYFEWEIETNEIHRPELAATPEGDGKDGTSIFFAFKENYYQKYDIFRHEGTFEQFQVVSRPIRKADDYWVLECRLITSNIDDSIDVELYNVGDTTRFLSNAHPEEHEEGKILVLLSSVKLAA